MFNCPDNYEDLFKWAEGWVQGNATEAREYVLRTHPVLCDFFNLPADFKDEELEKAYRKVRLKTHPDSPNGDKEKFMRAFEVYKELKSIHEYYKELTHE